MILHYTFVLVAHWKRYYPLGTLVQTVIGHSHRGCRSRIGTDNRELAVLYE